MLQVGCRVNVPFGSKKQYTALVVKIHNEQPQYKTKELIAVMDDHTMVLPGQMNLWKWIAEYYMCSLGEVFKAAIPSGLKEEDGKVKYRAKTVRCVRISEEFFSQEKVGEMYVALSRATKQKNILSHYIELSSLSVALKMQNRTMLKEVTQEELLRASSANQSLLKSLVDRGVLELYDKPISRIPIGDRIPGELLKHPLSEEQERARISIKNVWSTKDVCLLHGVTSSGKTEVYIHIIEEVINQGKQVLYLLPEIVLTAQLTERLRKVFGDRMGVYHSRYSDAERVEVYQKQVSDNPYDIIVGVRSSVLLPFKNLGLVVVDEEHETSFKQQEPAPRYHARNAALVLAKKVGAKVLLGSATPCLESYNNVQRGLYGLVVLDKRFGDVMLPEISVVDMKECRRKRMTNGPFSSQLLAEIRGALERHEQVILFQNRRGFAPVMECRFCGWTPQCPHCDVSMTYHKHYNQLVCHYCGHVSQIPALCPQCESDGLVTRGYGTERVVELLGQIFPQAKIARMDLDTTRSRQKYEGIIHDFQQMKSDILVGTQMVTKGLDFQRVSVVGILDATAMLNQPDFRSYERAYQMMSQVAGRAGRHKVAGRVILQTATSDSTIISQVIRNDYQGMFREQMEERQAFMYPPVCRLIDFYLKHRDERTLEHLSDETSKLMRQVFGQRVMGPVAPPIARVQSMYIRKLSLKVETGVDLEDVRQRMRQILNYVNSKPAFKSALIYADVDPL